MTGVGVTIAFWIIAVSAVAMSIAVVSVRHPLKSALFLVGVFFAVAAAFLLLDARLVAVLQILVYAGAIMVFILFVIMLLNLEPKDIERSRMTWPKSAGLMLALALGATGALLRYFTVEAPNVPDGFGQAESVAMILYTRFSFAFEALSLLLLIAIVGTVVLAGKVRGGRS